MSMVTFSIFPVDRNDVAEIHVRTNVLTKLQPFCDQGGFGGWPSATLLPLTVMVKVVALPSSATLPL